MPATLQTPKGTRCIRCATLIRNSRKNCPSCDLDLTGSSTAASSNGNSKSKVVSRVGTAINPAAKSNGSPGESGRNKARAARASMKLCPVCMSSVNESEMSESAGHMVCNTCAVKLKNKPARPAPGAPGIASASAPPQMAAQSEPEPRPVSNGGLPAKPIMSDDELLTAKGMQRQLMDKLLWIKVLVVILGMANIFFGGIYLLGGAIGGAFVSAVEESASDDMIKDEDFTDEDGNRMSAAKIKVERERIRENALKIRDEARSALFKVKLVGSAGIFIGLSFIVAFFMMKAKPFEICCIILVLYVLSKILALAVAGLEYFGMLDIFIIICTLSTLAEGVRTGMRIKDIRDRAEAATGRPVIAG